MKRAEKLAGIEAAIQDFYGQRAVAPRLIETILYSVEAGGKRIRPLLLLDLLEGFGVTLAPSHFQVAASVELIHTGSLIHDDLPAMDDDDYRRGRLTSHKQFGEDMAILAGDSLFLDAYALVARAELPSQQRVAVIDQLSEAAGTFGMVAGQVLDMEGEGADLDLSALQTIHAHKTGKLLAFPFVAAGILAEVSPEVAEDLKEAGDLLGLAFQIRDDILDVTATFAEIGKTPKKDLAAQKTTYPALLGLENSKKLLEDSLDKASQLLRGMEVKTSFDSQSIQEIIESLRLDG